VKTPYDPALRVGTRELEDLRAAIGAEQARLAGIDTARRGIEAALDSAAAAAALDPMLPVHAWTARMRMERRRLARDGNAASGRLSGLRDRALAARSLLSATEEAAGRFREEERRRRAAREQGEADDLAAAAFLRGREGGGRAR
jgi:hypothetical protein